MLTCYNVQLLSNIYISFVPTDVTNAASLAASRGASVAAGFMFLVVICSLLLYKTQNTHPNASNEDNQTSETSAHWSNFWCFYWHYFVALLPVLPAAETNNQYMMEREELTAEVSSGYLQMIPAASIQYPTEYEKINALIDSTWCRKKDCSRRIWCR